MNPSLTQMEKVRIGAGKSGKVLLLSSHKIQTDSLHSLPDGLNFRRQVVKSRRSSSMHIPNIFAVVLAGLTVLFVLGLVLFRVLWAGSSLARFGTLPRSLAKLQRWLHGEGKSVSTEHAGRRSRQFCLSARYSYRNASIGSIRSARITGGNVAAKATSSKVAKTALSEKGSWGFSSGTRNIASGLAAK